MCQFLETIKLNNGVFSRLSYHQSRIDNALKTYYIHELFDLSSILENSTYPKDGLYKCRIIFDDKIQKIEFLPYTAPIIKSLKMVETNIPNLKYKLANRTDYQTEFDKREVCDDVLLVKNGLFTDTSYCNIAFGDGVNWYTPRNPLITGVNREQLLDEGRIILKDVKTDDLVNFQYIRLFNALNEFGSIQLEIASIKR